MTCDEPPSDASERSPLRSRDTSPRPPLRGADPAQGVGFWAQVMEFWNRVSPAERCRGCRMQGSMVKAQGPRSARAILPRAHRAGRLTLCGVFRGGVRC